MNKILLSVILSAVALLLIFCIMVYPGIYEYSKLDGGSYENLIRINRITGEVNFFFPNEGWVKLPSE